MNATRDMRPSAGAQSAAAATPALRERITVLGAGVMGLAVATELADRGHEVALVDPAGGPGGHGCSWWAGGMLAPWCEFENAEEPVLRHGKLAIGWWDRQLGDQARTGGIAPEAAAPHAAQASSADTALLTAAPAATVSHHGTLVIALGRDRRELDRFARRTEAFQIADAARIAALEPHLAGRFDRALLFPEEAQLNPRAALTALAANLARRGIPILPEPPAGPSRLVDCRGLAARDMLPDLRGVRGEMLVLRCPDVTLSRPVRLLHPRVPIYLVPRGDGVYMLGATMIESDRRGVVTVRSVLELLSAAYALHPAFGEAEILETGADARPAFPDNLPRIGQRDGRLYANGLYRHGYLLAPACAMQLADHLETGTKPEFWHET